MLRLVAGTDRHAVAAAWLARHSELTQAGARVIVEVIEGQKNTLARYDTLKQYLGAVGARTFMKRFGYVLPPAK